MNDSFNRKLKMGSKWEQAVGEYLINQGWEVDYYTSYDNEGNVTGQRIIVGNQNLAHPDFTVQIKKKSGLIKKMYVEVKSLSNFYRNWGRLSKSQFPPNIDYLTIEAHTFSDYVKLHDITGLELRVIFIVAQRPKPWYWQEIEYLTETSRLAKYAYNYSEYDLHYLWDKNLLKVMNES